MQPVCGSDDVTPFAGLAIARISINATKRVAFYVPVFGAMSAKSQSL
jgi:hypothetical protein